MKTLTVYTPAYNRAQLLRNAYRSLISQTSDDFVWMIVDDGSTDETEEYVSEFIGEGKIEIEYYKKENGGKHTATNLAFEKVQTPLIAVSLDSDDILKPDAVEKIISAYSSHRECSGFVFMKEGADGKSLTKYRDSSLEIMSWRKAITEEHFMGEVLLVLKSSYAKRFRYPVIEGEKFFTEAYVYLQMTEDFFWSNESVYVAEYLDDGYTRNIISLYLKNPVSYAMYNDLRCEVFTSFSKRFRYAAYYNAFSILSAEKHFVRECKRPVLSFFALPLSVAFLLIIKLKAGRKKFEKNK